MTCVANAPTLPVFNDTEASMQTDHGVPSCGECHDHLFHDDVRITPVSAVIVDMIKKMCFDGTGLCEETAFNLRTDHAKICLEEYIHRIALYIRMDIHSLYNAVYYMYRLHNLGNFRLRALNMHKAWLACTMLAIKMLDDRCPNNKFFAKAGGINLTELNMLELRLLSLFNFDQTIDPNEYSQFAREMDCLVIMYSCDCRLCFAS